MPAGLTGAVREPAPARRAAPAAEIGPGDTAAILYTSGTTGPVEGRLLPAGAVLLVGGDVGELLEIGEDDVLYTCLPLFHTNALNAFVQALVAGATFVIGPRFSASRFWAQVAAEGATVTYLLGAMVNILHGRPPAPEDAAHRCASRSPRPPRPPCVEPFRERFGVQLVEGYGSTETNCAIGAQRREQRPAGWGAC